MSRRKQDAAWRERNAREAEQRAVDTADYLSRHGFTREDGERAMAGERARLKALRDARRATLRAGGEVPDVLRAVLVARRLANRVAARTFRANRKVKAAAGVPFYARSLAIERESVKIRVRELRGRQRAKRAEAAHVK
jgi:hypothetical protein